VRTLPILPLLLRPWRWTGLLAVCLGGCLNPMPEEEPSVDALDTGTPVGAAGVANQPSAGPGSGASGSAAILPGESLAPPSLGTVDSEPEPTGPDAGPAADAGAADAGL
jgi:hypothetical protein